MPAGSKDLKRRIKSIQNTKKITKAMELVAAAKMRKAVDRVLTSRDYAQVAWQMLIDLSEKVDTKHHRLLQKNKTGDVAILLITSNRGLCGAFNQNVIRIALEQVVSKNKKESIQNEVILFGKKGQSIAKAGVRVVAEFEKSDLTNTVKDILPLVKLLLADYMSGKYQKILLVYTDYVSSLKQVPRLRQLLPIVKADKYLGTVSGQTDVKIKELEFIYEPSPAEVLEYLLPRLMEMQIYQAVLESEASEHSARMMSMRNASDAASDMIDNLTLVFNQARQGAITAELADISGGRLAMEK
jgi:F-type H+-transporting ATPase subunit gamma